MSFEFLENGVIVVDDFQEDLGRDVFDVFGGQQAAPRIGNVLDHVVDQAHVPVDKVVPRPGLLPEAAIDELAVNVAQRHGGASSQAKYAQVDQVAAGLHLPEALKLYNCSTTMPERQLLADAALLDSRALQQRPRSDCPPRRIFRFAFGASTGRMSDRERQAALLHGVAQFHARRDIGKAHADPTLVGCDPGDARLPSAIACIQPRNLA